MPATSLIRLAKRDTYSREREKGRLLQWLLVLPIMIALHMGAAHAVEVGEQLANPVLEARARDVSAGLRCLVCQNQSIDDSEAPLAHDLRVLVRERLVAGDSDTQVRDYLVARYGPYILLRPPFSVATLILWLTPLLCLAAGAAALVARPRRRSDVGAPLDSAERDALAELTGRQSN